MTSLSLGIPYTTDDDWRARVRVRVCVCVCVQDHNNPSELRKCDTLAACPGGTQYGVGSDAWRKYGDFGFNGAPEESCWVGGKPTVEGTHVDIFGCPGDGLGDDRCVNLEKRLEPSPCFMSTGIVQHARL